MKRIDRVIATLNDMASVQADLPALPDGLEFPAELMNKITFDAAGKKLLFRGVMTDAEKATLKGLHQNEAYGLAIDAIYAMPRDFLRRNLRAFSVPDFRADLDALPVGLDIPAGLKDAGLRDRVYHDEVNQVLHFRGVMTDEEKELLRGLPNSNKDFRSAVAQLHAAADGTGTWPDGEADSFFAPEDIEKLISQRGYDLRVLSWGDGTAVPSQGWNLVVVGIDNSGLLHIRIFDAGGDRIIDTDEVRLPDQAAAISALKLQLPRLLPPHVLTEAEKAQVIMAATSIVGLSPQPTGEQRFGQVLERLLPHLKKSLSQRLVTQRLAEALDVEVQVSGRLLCDWIYRQPSPNSKPLKAIRAFLSAKFAESSAYLPVTQAAFPDQFKTYLLLHKAAQVINTLQLSLIQLRWLFELEDSPWPNLNSLPVQEVQEGATDLAPWMHLWALCRVRDSLPGGEALLDEIFALAWQGTDQAAIKQRLTTACGWFSADLDTLLGNGTASNRGALGFAFPRGYRSEVFLERLQACFRLLKRLGVSADLCRDLVSSLHAPNDTEKGRKIANAVVQAVRAKYDDESWLKVAKPLRDELRERQREALVAYLVSHPGENTRWRDANDLYAYFLVDPEMSPCMMTSRIKQAHGTVQLFVQRCLMNLEPDVLARDTTDDAWRQWRWMKNYRVWEANRKVFLYPENWIEPELRDDKSPFFKELESELLQGDLTLESAAKAMLGYLEKLDQVGHLEIVGVCEQAGEQVADGNRTTDILHVFGRTSGIPHVYYYRRRMDSSYWTPWEKVDLDINSEHLIPVVWNRRLYLFWPQFMKKAVQDAIGSDDTLGTVPLKDLKPRESWEIKLAWSEYQDKKWSPKRISTQAIERGSEPEQLVFRAFMNDKNYLIINAVETTLDQGGLVQDGLFDLGTAPTYANRLNDAQFPEELREEFQANGYFPPKTLKVRVVNISSEWMIEHDFSGFDLRVVSWGQGAGVPISGTSLIIVGMDEGGLLHTRVFDADGDLVTDTDERTLPISQASELAHIKQQLTGLSPRHVLTDSVKDQLLNHVEALLARYRIHQTSADGSSRITVNGVLPQTEAFCWTDCGTDPLKTFLECAVPDTLRGTNWYCMFLKEQADAQGWLYLPVDDDRPALWSTPGPEPFLLLPPCDGYGLLNRPFFYRDARRTFLIDPSLIDISNPLLNRYHVNPATVPVSADAFVEAVQPSLQIPEWQEANASDPPYREHTIPGELVGKPLLHVINPVRKPAQGTTVQESHSKRPSMSLPKSRGGMVILPDLDVEGMDRWWNGAVISKNVRFHSFDHPYVGTFVRQLRRDGLEGLLQRKIQNKPSDFSLPGDQLLQFQTDYLPTWIVEPPYPEDVVDFDPEGPYGLYNWELFFHVPLLIADRLRQNQRFEEAQKWFHYIFDPTDRSGEPVPKRYWKFVPFFDQGEADYRLARIREILELLAKGANPQTANDVSPPEKDKLRELQNSVTEWRNEPFNPHLIARLRTVAYQKTVVMKYIDNLIAWGDQLFRRDTIESINEATQLYILAAEILGRRPEKIPPRAAAGAETFNSLEPKLGDASHPDFSNPFVAIEEFIPPSAASGRVSIGDQPNLTLEMLYFCAPRNEKLLGTWDTVADRLFKIRHCMNIEGVVRQLPLFEPPIEPGLLVRAAAAGIDLGSVLNEITGAMPQYRFAVMAQKASEVCAEVKALGANLLATLEKRDGEALAQMRARHETNLLKLIEQIKKKDLDEAATNILSLRRSRDGLVNRYLHYQRLLGVQSPKVSPVKVQKSRFWIGI